MGPSRPSTIQCYNCKALMVVQPQASSNLGAMQQMAQGGALTPHMEKKQRKKREGPPRQPTAYNNFMKAELAKIKLENAAEDASKEPGAEPAATSGGADAPAG